MKSGISAVGIAGMLLLATTGAHAAIDDAKAKDLMKAGGCGACHTVDKKVVGPAFKDVAAKHKGEAGAVDALVKVVRAGGKGVYGPVPMPAVPEAKIGDADLHGLVEWILSK